MELEREPNPQPAPEATGSVSQEKKQRIITAVAVGVAILLAMLLGWMWTVIRRPAQQQKPTHTVSTAAANSAEKAKREADEAAEKAYEEGRRNGAQSNPAFNPNGAGQASGTGTSTAAEHKRTAKEDYDDLLAKAALADSTVAGENGASRVADTLKDLSRDLPNAPTVPQPNEEHKADAKLQPVGVNTLPAGTFIDCSLVNGLNGDNVGPVKFQVATDVYNPQTYALEIPQGSVFLGEAQKVSAQFQQRLAVSFDRLQLVRDGKLYEIKLDRIPGLDPQGAAALAGKVNNHYLQIFGASLAIGAIGGLAQIGSGSYGGYNGIDATTQVRNGISQSMAENASQVLNRFLTRLPTVKKSPGDPAIIYLPFGVDLSS